MQYKSQVRFFFKMSEWQKIKDVVFGQVSDLVHFYEKLKMSENSRSETPKSEESEDLPSDEVEMNTNSGLRLKEVKLLKASKLYLHISNRYKIQLEFQILSKKFFLQSLEILL